MWWNSSRLLKASQALSLSLLHVLFTFFSLVYLVHFYFISSRFRFSEQIKCFVDWIEDDNFQKLFTFTDEKRYMGKDGVSCFFGRSEINDRKEKKKYFCKRGGFKMHNLHTNRSEVSRKFVDWYFTKSWCSGVAEIYATDWAPLVGEHEVILN